MSIFSFLTKTNSSGGGGASLQNNLSATTAPTVNDDVDAGYAVGSLWIDVTGDEAYRCVDATADNAVWVKTTLDATEFATVMASTVSSATAKTTPVDADLVAIVDSEASNVLKKLTWANIKATLLTYFDTLYQPLDAVLTATTASFTTADESKLDGIESGATADQSDVEIREAILNTVTVASSTTPTPNVDVTDIYTITALAGGATFGAPTGTPVNGQKLVVRIKDDGTARSLAFNAVYRASTDLALPTTTVLGKTMYLGFMWNSTDSKWDLLALLDNF